MSYNGSMGGSSQEGAKYQPKFKDCKLEDKGGDKTLRRANNRSHTFSNNRREVLESMANNRSL